MTRNPPRQAAYLAALSDAQFRARKAFDLDAAMAALPPYVPGPGAQNHEGGAGVRLRSYLVADISDPLLREFARETLQAARMSEQYLDALRVVLGNQAEAERLGYVLEMNRRVSFAPERVMRTIIDQMRRAGITFGRLVPLGSGRSQVVQCFASKAHRHESAEAELEWLARRDEAAHRPAPSLEVKSNPWGVPADDVPY